MPGDYFDCVIFERMNLNRVSINSSAVNDLTSIKEEDDVFGNSNLFDKYEFTIEQKMSMCGELIEKFDQVARQVFGLLARDSFLRFEHTKRI